MASVSTIVIQIGDNAEKVLSQINEYFKKEEKLGQPFTLIDSNNSGGAKYPEKRLAWGGINYLNVEEFVELFLSLDTMHSVATVFNSDGDFCRVISKDVTFHVYGEVYEP